MLGEARRLVDLAVDGRRVRRVGDGDPPAVEVEADAPPRGGMVEVVPEDRRAELLRAVAPQLVPPARGGEQRNVRRGAVDGLGRTRVIQRIFNVSDPRARVPEKASTLRDRSER